MESTHRTDSDSGNEPIAVHHSEKAMYEEVITNIADEMRRGLTTDQAIDYVAVDKAALPVEDWAAIRQVTEDTITENVVEARHTMRETHGIDVTEDNEAVHVTVTNQAGIEHKLSPPKTLTGLTRATIQEGVVSFPSIDSDESFAARDATDELQLVYKHNSTIEAYYRGGDGVESRLTLWYDGESMTVIEPFDRKNKYESAKVKADIIIWDTNTPNSTTQ